MSLSLGGLVVKIGDLVLDGSVREQEAKLPTNYLINRNSSSGNDVKKDL